MSWVLYGATGYTGELLAEEAVARGHAPLLAGRSEEKLKPLAARLGLDYRAVSLDDPQALHALVQGHAAVLHAAGPFVKTSRPMVDACLDAGAHYLDITGELPVFEALYARHGEAQRAGVALISGVGFDVVPTDCLALYLANRVERPVSLSIALSALGQTSGGTARSAVGLLPGGGLVRRGGKLVPWALGRGARPQRFGHKTRWVMPAPLADLSSAYRSTGIADITLYMAVSRSVAQVMKAVWPLTHLARPLTKAVLGAPAVQRRLGDFVDARATGPDEATRARRPSFLWAEVVGASGERKEAWLETVNGYQLTRWTAVRSVERVLTEKPVGALTPAQAFGEDFILEFEGSKRLDTLP